MIRSRTIARSVMAGRLIVVAVVAAVIGVTGYVVAQERGGVSYGISRQTADGGGRMHATGGMYELSGTIGQPDAGVSAGGDYQMFAGVWCPVLPGDAGEDGNVDLLDCAGFLACSTGPNGGVPADGCGPFDVNQSGAIDLADFAAIQISFTGS